MGPLHLPPIAHHITRSGNPRRLCDGQPAAEADIPTADVGALREARAKATLCPACQLNSGYPPFHLPNSMPPPEAAPRRSISSWTAPSGTSPRTPPCGGRPVTSPARTSPRPWKSCSGWEFLAGKEPSPSGPTQADDLESITEQGRRPKAAAAAVPQPLVRRQPGAQAHQEIPGIHDHANPLGTNHQRRAARLGPRRPQQRLNTRNAGTLLSINNRTHRPSPKSSTKPPGAGAITNQQAHDLEATDLVLRGTGPDNLTVHSVTKVSITVQNETLPDLCGPKSQHPLPGHGPAGPPKDWRAAGTLPCIPMKHQDPEAPISPRNGGKLPDRHPVHQCWDRAQRGLPLPHGGPP